MTQTPTSFPVHGNAAAEHWAKEARKWHELTMVAVLLALLMMFVFSVAMAVALDHAHDAANRAARAAKDAQNSAESAWYAAWWQKHSGQTLPTYTGVQIMTCDNSGNCEVR